MNKVLPLYEDLLIHRYMHLVYCYAREVENYDILLERDHRRMASYLHLLLDLFCTVGDKVRPRETVRMFGKLSGIKVQYKIIGTCLT